MMKAAPVKKLSLSLLACVAFMISGAPAFAQDTAGPAGLPQSSAAAQASVPASPAGEEIIDPFLNIDLNQALKLNLVLRAPDTEPAKMKTLFFTLWQHELLQEAKRSFRTRPPTQEEIQQSERFDFEAPRERGPREVSVGGIVYKSPARWTVWLNGKRIAPDAIPKEVIDIKVYKKYVELKWYDSYTNLIYPIRLKPHQRFNLDSRIFLPGTGTM